MKKSVGLGVLLVASLGTAQADEAKQARLEQSKAVVKEFMTALKGELEQAMKSGGPVNAIEVCNRIAPALAKKESEKNGWDVGRTSLKFRNPNNAPDAWETKVLETFEQRKAKGEDVQSMAFAEVVEENGKKSFRFMKAIPTAEVCLKCHGESVDEPVSAKLKDLYPEDRARGYKVGDIRGAFTITQPM